MDASNLPDWRLHFAAEVSEVRSTGPDAPHAQAGDILLVITQTSTPRDGRVMIPVAGPYRLSLSIAIRAAAQARPLMRGVRFIGANKRGGPKDCDLKTTPALFDYFEQCMIAVTFSYQALETYANQVIDEHVKEGQTLTLKRRKGIETFDSAALQREVSTEEKIATVLPMLLGIALSKQAKLWQQVTILRRVRDSIIHLKSTDHIVRGRVDHETVWYRLLNNSPRIYPQTALAVMRHYAGGRKLGWLDHAEHQFEIEWSRAAPGASSP